MSKDNLPPGITDRDIDDQFGDDSLTLDEEIEKGFDEEEVEEEVMDKEL